MIICENLYELKFSHDTYVKGLLRCGLVNQSHPIIAKLTRLLPSKSARDFGDDNDRSPIKTGPSSIQPNSSQSQTAQQVTFLSLIIHVLYFRTQLLFRLFLQLLIALHCLF
jgi:hypothetical protein